MVGIGLTKHILHSDILRQFQAHSENRKELLLNVLRRSFMTQRITPKESCGCLCRTSVKRLFSSIYEPDGLDYVPDIPEYGDLCLKLRGYDYVVLQAFYQHVQHLCENKLGLEVKSWAVPCRSTEIQSNKPKSTQVEAVYNLSMYERCVKIQNMPSTRASLLLELVRQYLPEGVDLQLKEPEEEEDEYLYLPDVVLQEVQYQMQEIEEYRDERKKK